MFRPRFRRDARSALITFALAAAALGFAAAAATAQVRPYPNGFYQPNGIVNQTSLTAAGNIPYVVNGDGALVVEVTGTGASIVAEMDVAGDRSASPTWASLGAITLNGIYRFDVAGYAQARFHLTSLASGTVTVAMSGGNPSPQPQNGDLGAVITNTVPASVAATYNSPTMFNLRESGVVCTFVESSSSGSPSTTFAIQEYDSATNTYYSLLTSGAITGTTPTVLEVYPGIQTTSLPSTGVTMSAASLHLPRLWRVQEVIGGTGTPALGAIIGCNALR